MQHDEAFLDYVIKAIVDHPESVQIARTVDQMGVLLTLTVHKDDMGKIIGREGATAKSIRTLLRVAGMKQNARVNLKINEPDGSSYVPGSRGNDDMGTVADMQGKAPEHAEPSRMKSVDEVLADL